MLKKLLLSAALVCFGLYAQVKPGENLCVNGMLEAEQQPMPAFWEYSNKDVIKYNGTAGPNSTAAFIIDNETETPIRFTIRQHELTLIKDETYKVSLYVKTRNFKNTKHYGWVIINSGWHSEQGVHTFPENTDGWVKLEEEFKLKDSKDGMYGAALFFTGMTGHVEVAQLKLEAISEGALAQSHASKALLNSNSPRLIPITPVLYKIPAEDKNIHFLLGGIPPKEVTTASFQIDEQPSFTLPLASEMTLNLDNVSNGPHILKCWIKEKDEMIFEREYDICIVPTPKVDTTGHKRLNNLVTTILEQNLAEDQESCTISNPKDGWLFIDLKAAATASLDDSIVITADTPRHETFRYATKGAHTVTVKGGKGAKLTVRSIANIFNYPLCANSQVPQNGKYDWAFHEKYVFPAVTTLNGGFCEEQNIPKIREMGLRWIANLGTTNPKDIDDLLNRFNNSKGMLEPCYDGVTCDEQFFGRASLDTYTQTLWKYKVPEGKLIYTWIVGNPGLKGMHNDFMSASINTSKGEGLLLFEAYCHSRPTEEDAAEYLSQRINRTMRAFNEFYPNAAAHSGMLLGNFNQIPVISLDVLPHVDYKYYLDMQLNILANHPDFANLNTVGYWGSYYDDEELYRWSFKLLRHYAVEGKTDMLSKQPKYNYKYSPGLLVNCDFEEGTEGWTVDAASEKSVKIAEMGADFLRNSEGRWGSQSYGKHLCVLTRGEEKANTLSQVAKGLVPGRTYTLQFCSIDYDDQVAQKHNPYKLPLEATLGEGARIIPEKSYVYVDNRLNERRKKAPSARINLTHIRFVAEAENVSLTFSDEKAKPGKRYGFNYVMMKPYYDDEPIAEED